QGVLDFQVEAGLVDIVVEAAAHRGAIGAARSEVVIVDGQRQRGFCGGVITASGNLKGNQGGVVEPLENIRNGIQGIRPEVEQGAHLGGEGQCQVAGGPLLA